MIEQLHAVCRELLEEGQVEVVIGYGCSSGFAATHPVFITDPARIDTLTWNSQCHHNLVTYVNRPEVKSFGKAAVVLKACDERALIMLQRESQIDREDLVVIGVSCDSPDSPQQRKCQSCQSRTPQHADVLVGASEPSATAGQPRYAELEQFMQREPSDRMAYWQNELARCSKCYACRQVCPLCYCRVCIVDKNQPVCLDTAAHLKGNFAWQITRAFHLAGRCVGCDECTRACPVEIDLRLLNLSLAKAADEDFGFQAGVDLEATAVVGAFREQDQENFIR